MDPLTRLRAALSDRYEVEREIGAGGMATVYLARDIKHHRQVALKLLSPELGAVLGPERFLAEIRVTANLQHPNLLPLFDSGEAEGQLYYVMPYVEGESLRARLDRERQLSINEAVRIGTAIASALDYAHRHGVVHRDLKPENILLQEGQPLVADFGIALAVSNAGGARVTQTGLSLGTPQYMSPEQATGERQIDARSDIYSLGALIYEMLSGEPPHTGSTVQAIIARVLTDTPRDLRISRAAVPDHVAGAVHKALEKIPADRFENAREFSEALQGQRIVESRRSTVFRSRDAGSPRALLRSPWLVAGVSAAIAIAALASALQERSSRRHAGQQASPVKFVVELPGDINQADGIAISPDGQKVVYSARLGDTSTLFVRTMDDINPRPIAGTRDGAMPFFSPDGKWLGFFSTGKLQKIPSEGGTPTELLAVREGRGAFWAPDNRIYFSRAAITGRRSGLSSISANGGDLRTVTRSDSLNGETHVQPRLMEDGKTLLFLSFGRGGPEDDFLAIGSRDSEKFTVLRTNCYTLIGYVESSALCVAASGIIAIPLDLARRVERSAPVSLESAVTRVSVTALSSNGTIVFSNSEARRFLDIVDRSGKTAHLVEEMANYRNPRISPDGSRLAVMLGPSSLPGNLGVMELGSRRMTKLTVDGAEFPEWSPDGSRLFYSKPTRRDGRLWWIDPDRPGTPQSIEPIISSPFSYTGSQTLSPNGRDIVISAGSGRLEDDLFAMSLDSPSRKPVPWLQSQFVESQPRFSPDGKWLAYISNESGSEEVYVSQFPGPGPRIKISGFGGREPVWARNGRTVLFRTQSSIEAVDLIIGPRMTAGQQVRYAPLAKTGFSTQSNYDVLADGRVIAPQQAQVESHLIVYINWLNEVRKKLSK